MRIQAKWVGFCAVVVVLGIGVMRAQVTSVTATSPVTASPSTGTVTVACPTCVTSLTGTVLTSPTGTQAVAQPVVSGAQTFLGVNALNGFKYAGQYGSNGINDAFAGPNAFGSSTNQTVIVEPTYTGSNPNSPSYGFPYADQSHLIDYRTGSTQELFWNPGGINMAIPGVQNNVAKFSQAYFNEANDRIIDFQSTLSITGPGYDMGASGSSAKGWSTGHMFNPSLHISSRGIHQMFGGTMYKSSQGDTDMFYTYLTAFGGAVAGADEAVIHTGAHLSQVITGL